MNILNKFTIKSLKLNKKRTIVTIIGIMLSTALICGVAGLVSSFQNSLIDWARTNDGNYHVTFKNVESNKAQYVTENQKVKDYFISSSLGWANLEGSKTTNKPYLHVLAYDKKALENYGVVLTDGRLPQNSNEIVITESVLTGARVFLKIGDTITLNIGTRKSNDDYYLNDDALYTEDDESIVDTKEKTYTIVGFMDTLDVENLYSPGYSALTYMDETPSAIDISVLYKSPKEYEKTTKDICKTLNLDFDEDIYVNSDFLRFQGIMSYNMLYVLYTIAGVVIFIIVISSVFVIRNSFSISVAEKNRQYGMLSSVGATSKQIRKNVIFEGMVIGLIAIPLGILLGIVAIMILLKIVNYLLADMLSGLCFTYSINLLAVLISVAISVITIYLSCLIPARRAAKISPIESIRGNNDIKIKAKKLKTSKLTKKLFGIGGVIASKNLKRSKKKYRTTIISIAVSIFVFITMNSFIVNMFQESQNYYKDYDYNIQLNVGKVSNEEIDRIISLDNIEKYSILYSLNNGDIKIKDIDKINLASGTLSEEGYYDEENEEFIETGEKYSALQIMALDSDSFKRYVNKIGAKYDKVKDKGILCDEVSWIEDGQVKNGRKYKYNVGDIIEGKDYNDKQRSVEVGAISTIKPDGIDRSYYEGGYLILDISQLENEEKPVYNTVTIQSNNPDQLEKDIDALHLDIRIYNIDAFAKEESAMVLVTKIFLYGFITVITLIGITNIFNTITSNMELRQKEFAMLKSIGMTSKEFDRMINLETIFYGTKAWVIGTIMGLIGTFAIYKAFSVKFQKGMYIPTNAILISAVFVFIFIFIIMRYSIYKINKQNTIETIRNENV